MPHPHPPRPPYPPSPGPIPGEADDSIASAFKKPTRNEDPYDIAVLLARHWEPVLAYATLCTPSAPSAAPTLAAAALHKVLDSLRRGEPTAALRPQLLVTVRDIAKSWSTDERLATLLPDFRKLPNGHTIRTADLAPSDDRRLALRSFQAMSRSAQCLLWHTAVEAEPISVPAALLAYDIGTALTELELARSQFRAGCLRAHVELAPNPECRFYNRLLDVQIRRGSGFLPDVQQHLLDCRHCQHAAEQLGLFDRRLGQLLAEAVLGWGAQDYLRSRPRRRRPGTGAGETGRTGWHRRPGRHRLLPHLGAFDQDPAGGTLTGTGTGTGTEMTASMSAPARMFSRTPTRRLVTGVGVGSTLLLAAILTASLWPTGSDNAGHAAPGGAASTSTAPPGTSPATPPDGSAPPPPTSAKHPADPLLTRLRNAGADLCLDIDGGRTKRGATAVLAKCSTARTQMWSYEDDGLLRSLADQGLCLDSQSGVGVLTLGICAISDTAHANDVRYDLTVQGELVPRWQGTLAVAPVSSHAGADVVTMARDSSQAQRWLVDAMPLSPKSRPIAGADAPDPHASKSSATPRCDTDCRIPSAQPPAGRPSPTSSSRSGQREAPGRYQARSAEDAGVCDAPGPSRGARTMALPFRDRAEAGEPATAPCGRDPSERSWTKAYARP